MKIFQRDTNAALTKAKDDLAAVDQALIDLQQKRLAQLIDSEASEIEKIDFEISAKHRQRQVYIDKIEQLEARLVVETEQRNEAAFRQRLDRLDVWQGDRDKAAMEFEADVRRLSLSACKLRDVSARKPVRPAGVSDRYMDWFPDIADRIGKLTYECFDPRYAILGNNPRHQDYASRLYVAAEKCAGFAARLRESDQAVIRGLRHPAPPDPDDEVAEVEQAVNDLTSEEAAA
jgi:hypothetical protein